MAPQLTPKQYARMMERTEIDAAGCLMWTGPVNMEGYGMANGGTPHVLYYVYHNGPVPEGKQLAHSCHKKRCLIHARPKTCLENVQETSGTDYPWPKWMNGEEHTILRNVHYTRDSTSFWGTILQRARRRKKTVEGWRDEDSITFRAVDQDHLQA